MNEQPDSQRRRLLQTASAMAMIGATRTSQSQTTSEKTAMSSLPAFESQTVLKPLAFDPAKLTGC